MIQRITTIWLFLLDHPELWGFIVWPALTGLSSFFHALLEPRFPRLVEALKASGLDLPRMWDALRKVQPKVPPLPPGLSIAIVVALLANGLTGCCTSDVCRATIAANLMHDTADVAADVLDHACTERYRAASTPAGLAAIDEPCLPAAMAFGAFRRAHATLVALLTAIAAGDPGAGIAAALKMAEEATLELATRISEVQ